MALLAPASAAVPVASSAAAPPLERVGGPGIGSGSPAPFTTDHFDAFRSTATTEVFSSAAVGDITGDGRQTVVAGFPDGTVYGWALPDGHRVFKFMTGPGAVEASPALVDLDGNGVADVLAANLAGDIVGFNAAGKTLFRAHDTPNPGQGIFGTPTVADLDRDGRREVISSGWGQHIYAWHIDGTLLRGFPTEIGDSSWSSPSIADLDGDGYPEIIVGGDCDGVQGQRCYPRRGGYVWVFRHDGSVAPGFPRFVPDQVVWSSPAIVDLNGDGALDVVVGTGTNMAPPLGNVIYAIDRNGKDLPGWPVTTGGRVMGSPAIGDVDGDGRLDVVVPAEDGRIYAVTRTGQPLPGWPQCNSNSRQCPVTVHGSVALADVLGDGRPQVIHGGEQWLRVYGADGTLRADLETRAGTAPLTANPTVASVSGTAWIFQTAGLSTTTSPTPDIGGVWAWKSAKPLGAAPWPTFKQNIARLGTAVPLPTGAVKPAATTTKPRSGSTPRPTPAALPTASTAAPTTVDTTTTAPPADVTVNAAAPRRRTSGRGAPAAAAVTAVAAFALTAGALVRRWRKLR